MENSEEKKISLQLDNSEISDLDRAVAFQAASHIMERLKLRNRANPKKSNKLGYALSLAFINGISFARALTPEIKEELRKQYQPVIDSMFGIKS